MISIFKEYFFATESIYLGTRIDRIDCNAKNKNHTIKICQGKYIRKGNSYET